MVERIEGDFKDIRKVASSKVFNDFTQRLNEDRGTDTDTLTSLLSVCSSQDAATLFDTFLHKEAAETSAANLLKSMNTALTAQPTVHDDLKISIKNMEKVLNQVKERFSASAEMAGKLLGHMCIVQAMCRELTPGETRAGLLK